MLSDTMHSETHFQPSSGAVVLDDICLLFMSSYLAFDCVDVQRARPRNGQLSHLWHALHTSFASS